MATMRTVSARLAALGFLLSSAGLSAGCDDESGGGGGGEGGEDGGGGDTGTGGGDTEDEFADLSGAIRFANFVSNGTEGVDLDLYWGATLASGEFVDTVEYGEVTDYLTPRQSQDLLAQALLDEGEARYFLVEAGDRVSLPSNFLVNTDETFEDTTRETVVLSGSQAVIGSDLVVTSAVVLEHRLVEAPLGSAYVYVSSNAFNEIPDGDFVQVAAEGVCGPPTEPAIGNTGEAFVLDAGATGLFLTDANTECATGSTVADGTVRTRQSYLLIGKADTYDLDAREAVLVDLTPGM